MTSSRPLSPRFASLERSFFPKQTRQSDNSSKNLRENRLSPRLSPTVRKLKGDNASLQTELPQSKTNSHLFHNDDKEYSETNLSSNQQQLTDSYHSPSTSKNIGLNSPSITSRIRSDHKKVSPDNPLPGSKFQNYIRRSVRPSSTPIRTRTNISSPRDDLKFVQPPLIMEVEGDGNNKQMTIDKRDLARDPISMDKQNISRSVTPVSQRISNQNQSGIPTLSHGHQESETKSKQVEHSSPNKHEHEVNGEVLKSAPIDNRFPTEGSKSVAMERSRADSLNEQISRPGSRSSATNMDGKYYVPGSSTHPESPRPGSRGSSINIALDRKTYSPRSSRAESPRIGLKDLVLNLKALSGGSRGLPQKPLYGQNDSGGSVSSSRDPGPIRGERQWSVAIDALKERRQRNAERSKRNLAELDTLRKTLEESQAKSHSLEAEVEPLREKVKRYEGIIESLEDKLEENKQELIKKDRSRLSDVERLEKARRQEIENEKNKWEDTEHHLKDEIRRSQNEIKMLKKQVDELNESLDQEKKRSQVDEANHPKARQLDSMRKEMMQVRQVLEKSEKERLTERKEKLSALQNMIKLTKDKTDIEEELDERKKADTKESSDKYMRLTGKLAVAEMKLQKLRQEKASEIETMQKKYLEEIRQLKVNYERELKAVTNERDKLKEDNQKSNGKNSRSSSPVRNVPYHGRWSAMRSEDRKHLAEMKEIIAELESEGLGPDQASSDEVIRILYTKQKELGEKLQEAEEILSQAKNGDPRPVVQGLKEEKRTMKRKIDELQETLSKKESQLKLVEMSTKRQIEDLLTEKKNAVFEMQRAVDTADKAKDDAERLEKELEDTKATLQKRQSEMTMLRENLMSVTNEMKTVDADLGKTKKDLSVREAELARMNRDIDMERESVEREKKENEKLLQDMEEKRKIMKDSEKVITDLESKVQKLTESLQASKMHVERVCTERNNVLDQLQASKENILGHETQAKQSESVINNLRHQVKSLEYSLQGKVDKLAGTSLELEKSKADLLSLQHLLTSEEEKNKELEEEVDELTQELNAKTEEAENLDERNKALEEELKHAKATINDMNNEFADAESTLKEQSSTRTVVEKELSFLQIQHRELTREKQKLNDVLDETERNLQQKNERLSTSEKDLAETKQQLKEKMRDCDEIQNEKERLQEELTFVKQQNETLHEDLKNSKGDARQKFSEIERLTSQLAETTKRNTSLAIELKDYREKSHKKSSHDEMRAEALQQENKDLKDEIKASQAMLLQYCDAVANFGTTAGQDSIGGGRITGSLATVVKKLRNAENENQNHLEDAERYKFKISSLEKEIRRISLLLSDERSSMSNEMNTVMSENEAERKRLTNELRHKAEEAEIRKQEIGKLTTDFEKKLATADKKVQDKDGSIRILEAENSELKKSLSALQEQMTADHLRSSEKDKRVEETENKVSELTLQRNQRMDELRESKQRVQGLEDEIQTKDIQMDKLTQSLAEERRKVLQSQQEGHRQLQDLYEKISKLQEEKVRTETKLRQEKQDVEKELNQVKIQKNDQDKSVLELTMEREMLVNDKEYLENKVQNLEREVVKAKNEKRVVDEGMFTQEQAATEEAVQMQEMIQTLESGRNDLELALEQAQKELKKKERLIAIKRSMLEGNDREVQTLRKEVGRERKEKLEALSCLKALILDNESMAKCIRGLQQTITSQREENMESRKHLKEVLDKYEHQREISFRTQATLEGVMESRIARETHETAKLQEDVKMLRRDFDSLRKEKDKMHLQLDEKDKQVMRTRNEVDELHKLVENKIGDLDVERRAKEMLEGKLQSLTQDRNVAVKRLQSVEISNKMLQTKLLGLQKWHNNLEGSMIRSRDHSALSLESMHENQKRYEDFLRHQARELTTKLDNIENERPSSTLKNTFKTFPNEES